MERDVILKAEGLSYAYGEGEQPALDGLSLELGRGEKTAVLGANGSGKSTFFLCCNGLLRPQKGSLRLDGVPYAYDRKSLLELRRKVGVVFQDPDNQLFSADVEQEIAFGPLNLGLPEEQVRAAVDRVIDRLEIGPFRNRPVHALSGGQKKQVAIGDILVMEPELMLLDEPTAALDPRHRRLVRQLIDGLADRGITVVLSTHDVDWAFQWADRVLIFHSGRVLLQGSPEEAFRDRALLEQAGLEQPAVLRLRRLLADRGLLPAGGESARDPAELERLLAEQTK